MIVDLAGFTDGKDLGMKEREGLNMTVKSWVYGIEEWNCCRSAGSGECKKSWQRVGWD